MKIVIVKDSEGEPCLAVSLPEGRDLDWVRGWLRANDYDEKVDSELFDGDFVELEITTIPSDAVRPAYTALVKAMQARVLDDLAHAVVDTEDRGAWLIDRVNEVCYEIFSGDAFPELLDAAITEKLELEPDKWSDEDAKEDLIDTLRGEIPS